MNPSHRILLTGASGALGYHLLNAMAAREDTSVLGLLRADSKTHGAFPNVDYCHIDFTGKESVARVVADFRPTCIVHSAASGLQFPRPQWFDLVRFNVEVSIGLCECAAATPGCHFVYISTGLGYRDQDRPLRESDPMDTLHPYGASKAAADLLVRSAAAEFNVPTTVIRPFSFTGPGDPPTRLFPALLRAAAERQAMDLSPGEQRRDHCATADIAAGVVAAVFAHPASPGEQRAFNLGSGDPITLRAMVESVASQLGLDVELNFGARAYAPHEPMHLVADITQAREVLGWRPKINLAYSVWELARATRPELKLKEPRRFL